MRRSSYCPRTPGIKVETLDLLHACPIWDAECGRASTPFTRRILSLRERWSYQTVVTSAPLGHDEFLATTGDLGMDLQSILQLLSYWQCRTTVLWRVIGPSAVLDDLRGTNEGQPLPWTRSDEDVAASLPLSLFLCQHEIRGD